MGSYTQLYIDDYPIWVTKSYVTPEIMTVFIESDKEVFVRKVSSRNVLYWGSDINKNEEVEKVYNYRSSVKNVIDRLNIMGYTKANAFDDFKKSIEELKSFQLDFMRQTSNKYGKEELDFLDVVTIEDFICAFRELRKQQVPWSTFKNLEKFQLSSTARYLASNNSGWMLNFPFRDVRNYIRIYLESCSLDSYVVQDITEVTNAGYYELNECVRNNALGILLSDIDINSRIIVLTEGSSDRVIIERSLKLLYPHLFDYYRFMDFGLANASGGASSLVSQVKAFIGVGIQNKIVAFLDNDTAAYVAKKSLNNVQIPENIRILHYPNLLFAKNYPTIGPTGRQFMDVNKLAGSIELYLGKDILEKDGEYTLVEWHGFDKSLGKYQGELLDKKSIQCDFYCKLSDCEEDNSKILQYDWSGIQLVLHSLFTAFEL